jgi:hypothetical protein
MHKQASSEGNILGSGDTAAENSPPVTEKSFRNLK